MTPETRAALRSVYISGADTQEVADGVAWLIDTIATNDAARGQDVQRFTPIEGRALFVTGQTGAGKGAHLTRALVRSTKDRGESFVVRVPMPESGTRAALGAAVLAALGYPVRRATIDADDVWRQARFHLEQNEVRVLWIDEADDMVRVATATEVAKLANLFRALLQDQRHPLCLILSGQPDLERLMEDEAQRELKRRSRIVRLTPINAHGAAAFVRFAMDKLAAKAGLTIGIEDMDDLAERLRHATGGAVGAMIETMVEAMETAGEAGRATVSMEEFAVLHRRRTGAGDGDNIFLVPHWTLIDPNAIGERAGPRHADLVAHDRKLRRRKSK